MQQLTEEQFANLVALTSIRPGSSTHSALRNHLVLGMDRKAAYKSAGVTHQAMSTVLARASEADTRARAYIESLQD